MYPSAIRGGGRAARRPPVGRIPAERLPEIGIQPHSVLPLTPPQVQAGSIVSVKSNYCTLHPQYTGDVHVSVLVGPMICY
jgi:hypothetical protein